MSRWQSLGVVALAAAAALTPAAANAAGTPAIPTFAKDIAPIFQDKCEACHRPGSIAPMSLVTYEDARPWARSIKGRVAARQMPPWHIDKNVGIQQFKNDRSLSDRSFLKCWMPTFLSMCQGGICRAATRFLIDRAQGRESS